MGQREDVVAEAFTWRGTPFLENACIKGTGTDCSRFIAAVYAKVLNLVVPFPEHYKLDFWAHTDNPEKFIVENVKPLMREITAKELGLGDLVVSKLGHAFAHTGLVVKLKPEIMLINAYPKKGKVEVVSLAEDHTFRGREKKYFSPFPTSPVQEKK